MSTGMRIAKFAGIIVLCFGAWCTGAASTQKQATQKQKKLAKKPTPAPQLPPLPSGPTGPVPQIPLDSIAPVLPQVSYQSGQLTIVAPNSTLGDILRAVRKQTGAEIDVPEARERVVTHLGPGPAREVIAELLNGSLLNYVLLGSPQDNSVLTRVVLVPKGPEQAANQPPGQPPPQVAQPQPEEVTPDTNDAETAAEENTDENNADQQQPAEAEQPVASPDQQGVKTPQQLLQEMQQRQLQMQQQMGQPGQPIPGPVQQPQQPPQQQ